MDWLTDLNLSREVVGWTDHLVSGDYASRWAAALIALWAIGQWIGLRRRHLSPARAEIAEAVEQLLATPDDPMEFAGRYADLNQKFSNYPWLAPFWELYRATLIFAQGEGPVVGSRRPDGMIQAQAILSRRVDMRFYRALPGYLVAVGLLCTFAGLMVVLQTGSEGLAATELATAQRAMQALLMTAAQQFWPAMVGVIAAMIFSWRERRHFHELERLVGQFCRLLDERIAMVTTEQLTYSQLLEAKVQSLRLRQVVSHLDRPLTVLDDYQGMAVRVASQPPVETVMRLADSGAGGEERGLSKAIEHTLVEMLRQWQDQTGAEAEALRQSVEMFAVSLRNGGAMVDQQVDLMNHMQHTCQESVSELRALNQPFAEMVGLLRETLGNLHQVYSTMGRVAEEFPTATRALVDSNRQVMVVIEGQEERMQAMEGVVTKLAELRTSASVFPELVAEYMEKKAALSSPPASGNGEGP